MPQRMYEYLFLFDSGKTSGDVMSAVQALEGILKKHGSEILASRPWADQKLAYPIRHQKKGLYYLLYVRCESTQIKEIEHDLKLNENLLRFLTVVIDPKWEEEMLAVAKDEHVLALQLGATDDSMDGNYESAHRRGPSSSPAHAGESRKD